MPVGSAVCMVGLSRHEQVQEIKKLTQQIQMIQSEMGKHKESLEECLKVSRPVACGWVAGTW